MAMDRFTQLSIFLKVVETGSFSAAARALELSPSAVSKSVSRQEDRLGVLLFKRNSRSVQPTPEGTALYASGVAAREAMDMAEASVSAFGAEPSGTLRVHAMPMLAKFRLTPLLPEFLARYPNVRVDFRLGMEMPDPVRGDVDVFVRSGIWRGSDVITRQLGYTRSILCAAPSYLARHGPPQSPEDLVHHDCLVRPDRNEWQFQLNGARQRIRASGSVSSSDSDLLLILARAGVGLIWFSEHLVQRDLGEGRLVRLLVDFEVQRDIPVFVGYPHRRHLHPRTRAFVDFLVHRFI